MIRTIKQDVVDEENLALPSTRLVTIEAATSAIKDSLFVANTAVIYIATHEERGLPAYRGPLTISRLSS